MGLCGQSTNFLRPDLVSRFRKLFAQRQPRRRLPNLTFEERQQLFQLLVEDIRYQGDQIVVRTILPIDDDGIEDELCAPVRGWAGGQIQTIASDTTLGRM